MAKKKFYITKAIDYPNGKPHLGHAYEAVVADALARWHKLLDKDVFFLGGTDEHGQKVERAAKRAGKEPQQFLDELIPFFKQLAKDLSIENDRFIRTSDKDHEVIVQKIWNKLVENDDIYKGEYEGLYCTGCEAFYLEREAEEGKCPIHKNPLEVIKEETYFFRLSKYEDKLLEHYQKHPEFILPKFRANEILNFVKEGLQDISVSRSTVKWGVPVPNDEKHTIYVWIDALPNYISALGYPEGDDFKKYWPADVQIVGKDINRFHTVIWPAILMALGEELPKTVHAHGFVNVGGEKLSKTTGITVDPIELAEKYSADAIRYFFLREIPAGQDGNYSETALIERVNGDVADGLGNLLNRVSTLAHKFCKGEFPTPSDFKTVDEDLIKQSEFVDEVDRLMQNFEWHKALERIWHFVRYCNQYLNFTQPWKHTDEPERLNTVLYSLLESLRILSIVTWPFIPNTAEKVAEQLGQEIGTLKDAKFSKKTKGKLKKPKPVFLKLEKVEEDIFSSLNLKVGEILEVHDHPDAEKLFVLHINLGSEHRQLVAGVKAWYKPEELVGKKVVIVSNLAPAKLRGVKSEGMMLAAEQGDQVKVLEAKNAKAGDQVKVEGVNPKQAEIKIDLFAKIKMSIKDGKAVYNDKLLITDSGSVTADLPDGAKIR
jgi:methionyl-tRNA synthetase